VKLTPDVASFRVKGPELVEVEVTRDALALGLDLALPEQVQYAAGVGSGR